MNVDMINFINFLNHGNLISLNASGVPFTLSNCHSNNTKVFERLDRVVANSVWLNMYPNYRLHNYPFFDLDHSPILLKMMDGLDSKKIFMFKFEEMWLKHPNFKSFAQNAWKCDPTVHPNNQFSACACTFKFLVSKRSKNVYGNIKERKRNLLNELEAIQQLIMNNYSVDLVKEKFLRDELNHVLISEEIMWA